MKPTITPLKLNTPKGIISAMTSSEISVAAMPVPFQPSFACQLAGLPLPTIQ